MTPERLNEIEARLNTICDSVEFPDGDFKQHLQDIRDLIARVRELEELVDQLSAGNHNLRHALMEFVKCETLYGHTGQHADKECVDCLRVNLANSALSHGYLKQTPRLAESDALINQLKALQSVAAALADSLDECAWACSSGEAEQALARYNSLKQ